MGEEDIVAESEGATWNWNKKEVEEPNETEDEVEFNDNSFKDNIEETSESNSKTIVWNLNDNDADDEITAASSDFTDEIKGGETQEHIEPVYTNRIPDEEKMKRS